MGKQSMWHTSMFYSFEADKLNSKIPRNIDTEKGLTSGRNQKFVLNDNTHTFSSSYSWLISDTNF